MPNASEKLLEKNENIRQHKLGHYPSRKVLIPGFRWLRLKAPSLKSQESQVKKQTDLGLETWGLGLLTVFAKVCGLLVPAARAEEVFFALFERQAG
jgi:hypothetical protein